MLLLLVLLLLAAPLSPSKQLSGLSTSFCVLQQAGQVYCAGENNSGMFGRGTTSREYTPQPMLHVKHASDVCVGKSHACIVDEGGTARCAGSNFIYHLLGDGTSANNALLQQTIGLERGVQRIECGAHNTCTLSEEGTEMQCWGYNYYGTLGNSTAGSSPKSPVLVDLSGVAAGGKIVDFALGNYHLCIVNAAGAVYCAGQNQHGQLGDGTSKSRSVPTKVVLEGGFAAASVACGDEHTCVVLSDGSVACWGENYYGQLGFKVTGVVHEARVLTPTVLPFFLQKAQGGERASKVWASGESTFVISAAGAVVYAFGHNQYGVLGTGNTTIMYTPAVFNTSVITGDSSIQEIRGGQDSTCVLTASRQVWCVGRNSYGQFGVGPPASAWTSSSSLTLKQMPVMVGLAPTASPTLPTASPTTGAPSPSPTLKPTAWPTTNGPTLRPTLEPTYSPTMPTRGPSKRPSKDLSKRSSSG